MTPQEVGWALTSGGIIISLGWNFFNQHRTGRIATELRKEQYHTAQWERIRGKIDAGVDGLVVAGRAILKQAQELDDAATQNFSFDILNGLVVDAQDELALALEEADASDYCLGKDWLAAANGPSQGWETAWDTVVASLAEAGGTQIKAERVAALSKLREPIRSIKTMVQERCRIQDLTLDPARLGDR